MTPIKRQRVFANRKYGNVPYVSRWPSDGFTIIELMVTITVIAILMLVASPNLKRFHKNGELTSAINNFSASLSTARAEAMRRNIHAIVAPVGATWASGWRTYADVDNDGTYTANTDDLLDTQLPLPPDVTVTATVKDLPTGVSFSGNGYPQTTGSSNFLSGNLQMTNGLRSRRLVLQPTGQISVCDPAASSGKAGACP